MCLWRRAQTYRLCEDGGSPITTQHRSGWLLINWLVGGLSGNPLFLHEVRRARWPASRRHIAVVGTALALAGAGVGALMIPVELAGLLAIVGGFPLTCVAAVFAAVMTVQTLNSRDFELLRLTPVPATEIVKALVATSLFRLRLLLLITVGMAGCYCAAGVADGNLWSIAFAPLPLIGFAGNVILAASLGTQAGIQIGASRFVVGVASLVAYPIACLITLILGAIIGWVIVVPFVCLALVMPPLTGEGGGYGVVIALAVTIGRWPFQMILARDATAHALRWLAAHLLARSSPSGP